MKESARHAKIVEVSDEDQYLVAGFAVPSADG
jgi:hypothetical protein